MLPTMLKHGIDPRMSADLPRFLQQARLELVQTRLVKLPIGDWGVRIGKLASTGVNWCHGLQPGPQVGASRKA